MLNVAVSFDLVNNSIDRNRVEYGPLHIPGFLKYRGKLRKVCHSLNELDRTTTHGEEVPAVVGVQSGYGLEVV